MICNVTNCNNKAQYQQNKYTELCFKHFFECTEHLLLMWRDNLYNEKKWKKYQTTVWVFNRDKVIIMNDKYKHKYESQVVHFVQEKNESINEFTNEINSFLEDMDVIDIKFAVDDKKWQAMVWYWPINEGHTIDEH